MISDQISKSEFIVQTLDKDMQNIYKSMLLIAQQNIYVTGKELKTKKRAGALIGRKTGSLMQSLESPDYVIQSTNTGYTISAGIVQHMRFMDMKKFGNRQIYNRQVWGILYNNTLKTLHSYYGKATYDYLGAVLQEAFATPFSSNNSTTPSDDYAKGRGRS